MSDPFHFAYASPRFFKTRLGDAAAYSVYEPGERVDPVVPGRSLICLPANTAAILKRLHGKGIVLLPVSTKYRPFEGISIQRVRAAQQSSRGAAEMHGSGMRHIPKLCF